MRLNPSRLTRRWDRLGADELRALQESALRRYLTNEVVPFSAYYRDLFDREGIDPRDIRTLEDFAKVPFTSKRKLIDEDGGAPRTRDFVIAPDEEALKRRPSTVARTLYRGPAGVKADLEREYRPIFMTSTTGRSSDPVPFLYTAHDLDNLARTGRRMMEVCESWPESRHLNLFPFAPHLAFWLAHYAGVGYDTFMLSTGGGKVMGTEGNVRMLGQVKPDALIGMPTFVYHVLQLAVERGVECPSLCRIVLGGEKVPRGMRRKLRGLCAELGAGQVDVMSTYGFTEAKMAWPECPARDVDEPTGFHLYPDLGIVEVVDPETGEPLGDGEPGEIVFTALDSRGSVVVRYRTGDLVAGGLTHEPCPGCGRTAPRLLGRISRVTDVRRLHIGKVKGTLVNFNDLEHVLDDFDEIGAWQIELRKRNDDPLESDEIVVHAAPVGGGGGDDLAARIEERIHGAAEIRPNRIAFHEAEALRRRHGVGRALKEEKVVDRRDEALTDESADPSTSETPTTNPLSTHEPA